VSEGPNVIAPSGSTRPDAVPKPQGRASSSKIQSRSLRFGRHDRIEQRITEGDRSVASEGHPKIE
jgi:hypothetical protein